MKTNWLFCDRGAQFLSVFLNELWTLKMSVFLESFSRLCHSLRMRQIAQYVRMSVFEWAALQSVMVLRGMTWCSLVRGYQRLGGISCQEFCPEDGSSMFCTADKTSQLGCQIVWNF
jgi:hypothetical protein